MSTGEFPVRKQTIFRKVTEIKVLRGGVPLDKAQEIQQIDTEMVKRASSGGKPANGIDALHLSSNYSL